MVHKLARISRVAPGAKGASSAHALDSRRSWVSACGTVRQLTSNHVVLNSCGKTLLATKVIQHLDNLINSQKQPDEKFVLAYFFCDLLVNLAYFSQIANPLNTVRTSPNVAVSQ